VNLSGIPRRRSGPLIGEVTQQVSSSHDPVPLFRDQGDRSFTAPAIFDKIGQRFRQAVGSFADANHIPWVRFAKGDR
jgi:hypothetical protein